MLKRRMRVFPPKMMMATSVFERMSADELGEWVVAMGFGSEVREAFIGKSVFCHRAYRIH